MDQQDHYYDKRKPIIGLLGLIGAGKSTLAYSLGEQMGLKVYKEDVSDNPLLPKFYDNMKKYSFPLQVNLLNQRFSQIQEITWRGKGGIQDRTIYEDTVFAKMLLNSGLMERDLYDTYIDLFNNMLNSTSRPSIIIYLYVTPEVALERIHKRGREMEIKKIDIDYMKNLYTQYELFIEDISGIIPVIKINWNVIKDTEEIAAMIKGKVGKVKAIYYVGF